MKYKAGELLLMSHGEYSDYAVRAVVRVLKDFDSREVSLAYPGKTEEYEFDEDEFLAYLTKEGYVEDIEYQEWCTGSFGRMDIPEKVDDAE